MAWGWVNNRIIKNHYNNFVLANIHYLICFCVQFKHDISNFTNFNIFSLNKSDNVQYFSKNEDLKLETNQKLNILNCQLHQKQKKSSLKPLTEYNLPES